MTAKVNDADAEQSLTSPESETTVLDLLASLARRRWTLALMPLVAAAAALGSTYLLPPVYTAKTTFIPPQAPQSSMASALAASLGNLGSLTGATTGLRTPADQYVALLESETIRERIVQAFNLSAQYRSDTAEEARLQLSRLVRAGVRKKDGLIAIEVDDPSPVRAAEMANRFVKELLATSNSMTVTEAQQRRVFFQKRLDEARDRVSAAQRTLEQTGFTSGALKLDPKTSAERYARLSAEAASTQVRLETLRGSLTESSTEVRRELATLSTLRSQIAALESNLPTASAEYIQRYRDYKYAESLFDMYFKHFEAARSDEAREGTAIQVVDVATPPQQRSWPRRGTFLIAAYLGTFFVLASAFIAIDQLRVSQRKPGNAKRWQALRLAWGRSRP
jgi:uncharacterized protein involved in exopolysaccharide biosynthesis